MMLQTEEISLARRPFRGLKQTACCIAGVLLATGICWGIWARVAHRKLQAEIDAIVTAHQPFEEKDFAGAPLPDDRNAAVAWKAVFALLPANDDSPSNSNLSYPNYPPFSPEWHQKEDNSIVVNAKVLTLSHAAAGIDAANWGIKLGGTSAIFNGSRETANIIGDAVLQAHMHGNDAVAIERAIDVVQLSRAEGEAGSLVANLVSTGIYSLAAARILEIAPDLNVDSALRPRAQVLIHLLLNESAEWRSRISAVDWERAEFHQICLGEKKRRWVLGPLIDLSEVRSLRQRRVDRLAGGAASFTDAEAIYRSQLPATVFPPSKSPGSMLSIQEFDVYSQFTMQTFSRAIESSWKGVAVGRSAAIALAIRLYRLDHADRWPAELKELVPAYLPSVPEDPFEPEGTPIGYVIRKHALADGNDRPMLYFAPVGDANTAALPAEPSFGWNSNHGSIGPQWRDLSRWYPVATSSP